MQFHRVDRDAISVTKKGAVPHCTQPSFASDRNLLLGFQNNMTMTEASSFCSPRPINPYLRPVKPCFASHDDITNSVATNSQVVNLAMGIHSQRREGSIAKCTTTLRLKPLIFIDLLRSFRMRNKYKFLNVKTSLLSKLSRGTLFYLQTVPLSYP